MEQNNFKKSIKRGRLTTLLLLLGVLPVFTQQFTPLTNPGEFNTRLTNEAAVVNSIESDFTQVKYLDIFDEKITSTGTFSYLKPNRISMHYTRPVDYLIVINDNRIKIVSDGKTSVNNLSSNKMMKEMQDMLAACMTGDLSRMSSAYRLEYFENSNYYRVEIVPVNRSVQQYIRQIEIILDKKDMSVHLLKLWETATDYTEYEFRNKRFNSLTDENRFTIR